MLMVVALLIVGAGTAFAWDERVSTVIFDGTTLQLTVKGTAKEFDGDPSKVSGTLSATRADPTGPLLLDGEATVTCLDIRGNTVGGIARITKDVNPALVGRDVYATGVDGGPGGVDRLTVIPLTVPGSGCAPQPQLATASFTSGGLVITNGEK